MDYKESAEQLRELRDAYELPAEMESALGDAINLMSHIKDGKMVANLSDKCGSCKYFVCDANYISDCYGRCHHPSKAKPVLKQRTSPACKRYEYNGSYEY